MSNLHLYRNRYIYVTGKFDYLGHRKGFYGRYIPTALVQDIRDTDGNALIDHLWFKNAKPFKHLKNNTKISFKAKVTGYVKGYNKDPNEPSRLTIEYQLTDISNVKILNKRVKKK